MITLPPSFRATLVDLGTRVPDRVLAILALTAAVSIWGSSAVATKAILDQVPPVTLAFIRWTVALALLLPMLYRSGARPARGRTIAALGLTGVALFYLSYNWGLRYTTAANGTLIHGGGPVLTALISVAFLGERPSARRWLGIVASLIGVMIIVLMGGSAELDASLLGNLLVVASVVSWAVYTVLGRRTFSGGGSLAVVTGSALYGMAMMLPVAIVELVIQGVGPITLHVVLIILFLSLGASASAYLLWGYGLKHLEASQAAVFTNGLPVAGVTAAALFGGERVTAVHIGGGIAIIAGVWLATGRQDERGQLDEGDDGEEDGDGTTDEGTAGCVSGPAAHRAARGGHP